MDVQRTRGQWLQHCRCPKTRWAWGDPTARMGLQGGQLVCSVDSTITARSAGSRKRQRAALRRDSRTVFVNSEGVVGLTGSYYIPSSAHFLGRQSSFSEWMTGRLWQQSEFHIMSWNLPSILPNPTGTDDKIHLATHLSRESAGSCGHTLFFCNHNAFTGKLAFGYGSVRVKRKTCCRNLWLASEPQINDTQNEFMIGSVDLSTPLLSLLREFRLSVNCPGLDLRQ